MYSRFIRSPDSNSVATALERDVVGAKGDSAVINIGTTKSALGYLKGIIELMPKTVASATAVMVNGDTLFTVAGGPIDIINLMSVCIADSSGTASTLQYSVTHALLGDVTISGASGSLVAVTAGMFVTLQKTALSTAALLATEGATIASTGPSAIIMLPGLIKAVIGTGTTTSTWKHYLTYRALTTGVTVV